MIRPLRFLLVAFLAAGPLAPEALAQPSAPDTLTADDGWLNELTLQFAGSQAQYLNWQEGGIDAISFSAQTEGVFYRISGPIRQAHEVRFALGLVRQDTLSFRKADDVARYGLGLEVETGGPVRPSFTATARTQFIAGFEYSPAPEDYPTLPREPSGEVKVADAFAPLVLTQSAGVVYDPGGGFTARTGLGLKETVVTIERLRAVYGNGPDETVRVQAGLDAELRYRRAVWENVTLSSRLSAFQAFNQIGDQAPDVLFENRLTMQVNPILNVTLDAAALYDRDVSMDLQLRQTLAVGVGFTLL